MERGKTVLISTTIFLALIGAATTTNHYHLAFAQIPGAIPAEPTMLAYENAQAGFSIEHPAAWIPIESDPLAALESGITTASFISLPEDMQDQFAESVTVLVEDLAQPMTLEQFTASQKQILDNTLQDAQLIEEEETDNATLAGLPAHKIVYDVTLNTTLTQEPIDGRIMEIWAVGNDNVAYVIHFEAERAKYEQFLDQANRIIGSFQLTTQTAAAGEEDSASAAANATETNMTTTTAGNASGFEASRQELLSDWQQTPFSDSFSTYIESGSDQGYGVYTEHASNIFSPDDTVELYLEPIGFSHKPVLGDEGEQLYLINLTASVQITQNMTTSPEAVQAINQTISDIQPIVIVSHRQNTELYMTIPVYLYQSEVPEGEYTITYRIEDGVSGQSFTIEKDIRIAETVSSTG